MSQVDLQYYVMAVRFEGQPDLNQGTAFLVSREGFGYAVTCHHVVGSHTEVELYFGSTGQSVQAELVPERSSRGMDIAVLRLLGSPPDDLMMLLPSLDKYEGEEFESFGFSQRFSGLEIEGKVDRLVDAPPGFPETPSGKALQLRTSDIAKGDSGAPVIIKDTKSVVGIVVWGRETEFNIRHDLAFALPIDVVWHIWPELRPASPSIRDKHEWLDLVGLSGDPFEFPDGGKDPNLRRYFYRVRHYWDVLNLGPAPERLPKTLFVFAASGCGKSALRNVVSQQCLVEGSDTKILPVSYLSLRKLINRKKLGHEIGPQDHVEQILEKGIRDLVGVVRAKGKIIPSISSARVEERNYLWAYVEQYHKRLTARMKKDLEEFIAPTGVEYSLPDDYADRLGNFCETITSVGFDAVYFLVDPTVYDGDQVGECVLLSLLSDERLLDLSQCGGAFKLFLDQSLMDQVRDSPSVRLEMVAPSPLEWSNEDLLNMLALRIEARLIDKGSDPLQVFGRVFEEGHSLNFLLERSRGNPRYLITSLHHLIKEHCQPPIDRENLQITHAEVERVVNFLGTPGQEEQEATWLAEMVAKGESGTVEFKSTLRYNTYKGQRDKAMESEVARTLCGFMNAEGGTLLIGIDDQGNALGLDNDFSTLRKKTKDGFELAFNDIATDHLGPVYRQYIDVSFENYQGKLICVIRVRKSPEPVYCQHGQEYVFYIRVGNSTKQLDAKETVEYVRQRWGLNNQ